METERTQRVGDRRDLLRDADHSAVALTIVERPGAFRIPLFPLVGGSCGPPAPRVYEPASYVFENPNSNRFNESTLPLPDTEVIEQLNIEQLPRRHNLDSKGHVRCRGGRIAGRMNVDGDDGRRVLPDRVTKDFSFAQQTCASGGGFAEIRGRRGRRIERAESSFQHETLYETLRESH